MTAECHVPAQDFGLHVPIDAMMATADKDASGTVDFKEFQALLD